MNKRQMAKMGRFALLRKGERPASCTFLYVTEEKPPQKGCVLFRLDKKGKINGGENVVYLAYYDSQGRERTLYPASEPDTIAAAAELKDVMAEMGETEEGWSVRSIDAPLEADLPIHEMLAIFRAHTGRENRWTCFLERIEAKMHLGWAAFLALIACILGAYLCIVREAWRTSFVLGGRVLTREAFFGLFLAWAIPFAALGSYFNRMRRTVANALITAVIPAAIQTAMMICWRQRMLPIFIGLLLISAVPISLAVYFKQTPPGERDFTGWGMCCQTALYHASGAMLVGAVAADILLGL